MHWVGGVNIGSPKLLTEYVQQRMYACVTEFSMTQKEQRGDMCCLDGKNKHGARLVGVSDCHLLSEAKTVGDVLSPKLLVN
jgi:hypothetical protein